MIRKFFLRDNIYFGIAIGVILPLILWLLLKLVIEVIIPDVFNMNMPLIKPATLSLIAIFVNLLSMRYYLLRLKFDFTGRGILISTFVLAIYYFTQFF